MKTLINKADKTYWILVLKRCIYECPCSPSLGKENSVFGTIKASVKLFEYAPKRIVV